jgi:hypothetical protein
MRLSPRWRIRVRAGRSRKASMTSEIGGWRPQEAVVTSRARFEPESISSLITPGMRTTPVPDAQN